MEISLRPTLKRFWLPLLVTLPLAGMLLAAPLWQRWREGTAGLDPSYRYHFIQPPSDSITLALGREIAFYQERVSRNPQDGLDRTSLASTYLKMARATGDANWYVLAEQEAKRSLTNLPFNNYGATLVLARVAEAKHEFKQAIQLANQVLQGQPDNSDAFSILVTANLAIGKVDAADRAADLLVGQIPTQGSLALRALVKVAQGKDAVAIENFRQALAAEEPGETGSSAWTRTLLARFYFKRGNPQQAIALYNETLRVLPKYPLALVNLAELETRLGRYQAAEQHYSQVFVSPAYPNVFDHVALQGLSRIKQLQGDSVAAKDLRDKAENLLRQHLSLNAFGHRRVLARLLLDGGDSADVAEALTLMQAEVKVRRDAETLDTLAWALSRSDRWQEARQVMQEALRWGIRDAAMFYRVGAIEQALGNPTQAIAYFERAQATDPSFNEQARQTLGLGGEIGY